MAELVSSELPQIGLEHQLSQLTNRAFPVSVTGGLLVSGLGLLRSKGIRQAVSSGIAITVAAVPDIVRELRARGYTLVTMSELVQRARRNPPLPPPGFALPASATPAARQEE